MIALESIGETQINKYLEQHGMQKFIEIFDRNKQLQFENNSFNEFVLDMFKKWGKITEYQVKDNGKIHVKRR